ncbi:thioredoxin fold domain-containing protein [Vibrio sp.]|uniref:thioredoxin fold domain-containing protein n=1 Tax=Vibrio sp. TaxID=678 RepID=UPI003D0FBABD
MRVLRRFPLLLLPFFVSACYAESTPDVAQNSQEQAKAAITIDQAAFEQRFAPLGLTITEIVPSDIDGLVEVRTSGGVLFASPDGDFFIAGTLYSIDADGRYEDVLAKRQAPINAEKVAARSEDMIEFKAENEKYAVTVFTDITCGYCVRLHSQMEEYNQLGITVRYLAYPRQGPTGPVAEQMAAIWCADDRAKALGLAKAKREIPEKNGKFAQCQQVIQDDYNLGRELGISGTPAIVMPNGEMLGGYLPPAELLKQLQRI